MPKVKHIACESKAGSLAKVKLTLSKSTAFADEIISQVYKDFPIYKFLGKLAKNKLKLPEEVIIGICNSYLKNKSGIKDKWAWFMITAKQCWADYNARKNITDSAELNKLSDSKEIRQLVEGVKKGV